MSLTQRMRCRTRQRQDAWRVSGIEARLVHRVILPCGVFVRQFGWPIRQPSINRRSDNLNLLYGLASRWRCIFSLFLRLFSLPPKSLSLFLGRFYPFFRLALLIVRGTGLDCHRLAFDRTLGWRGRIGNLPGIVNGFIRLFGRG